MNTHTLTKSFAALSFVLCSTIACEVSEKQIGQLDAGSESDESGTEGSEAQLPESCSDAVDSLEAIFDATEGQHCAMLVVFDYETFEPTRWAMTCDDGELGLSVEQARALTTWGGEDISEPLDEPANDRSFIFYDEPGGVGLLTEGGVGWVSNHAGLLFDASISSDGVGEIQYPIAFVDPSELGTGCTWLDEAYEVRAYDLTKVDYVTDYQLPEGHGAAVFGSFGDTAALRAARRSHGGKFYLDILAYPRTVDDFDSSTAEYVLVLEWWD
jgi:hypothetical protein